MTPWTVAHQAPPLSMGFSRQEYWSELPFPSLGHLPDPGIEPTSPVLAVICVLAGLRTSSILVQGSANLLSFHTALLIALTNCT